jgi:hypothetical protein
MFYPSWLQIWRYHMNSDLGVRFFWLNGIRREKPQILGCVGGCAAHTPQNLGFLTANPIEPNNLFTQIL